MNDVTDPLTIRRLARHAVRPLARPVGEMVGGAVLLLACLGIDALLREGSGRGLPGWVWIVAIACGVLVFVLALSQVLSTLSARRRLEQTSAADRQVAIEQLRAVEAAASLRAHDAEMDLEIDPDLRRQWNSAGGN